MHRLLVICALGVAMAGPTMAAPTACLPDNLVGALSKKYPGWKVIGLGDLRTDDQAILRRAHKDQCPGVAHGKFDGQHDAYAVTLMRQRFDLRQILVVVTPSPDANATVDKLDSEPERVAVLSVVSRVPPGVVETTNGSKIRMEHDGIGFETLEAGMLIYYFDGRQYRSAQVSE